VARVSWRLQHFLRADQHGAAGVRRQRAGDAAQQRGSERAPAALATDDETGQRSRLRPRGSPGNALPWTSWSRPTFCSRAERLVALRFLPLPWQRTSSCSSRSPLFGEPAANAQPKVTRTAIGSQTVRTTPLLVSPLCACRDAASRAADPVEARLTLNTYRLQLRSLPISNRPYQRFWASPGPGSRPAASGVRSMTDQGSGVLASLGTCSARPGMLRGCARGCRIASGPLR